MPQNGHVRVVVTDESIATSMRRCHAIEVVAACGDSSEALRAIRALRPDVAVLDASDGFGVLEALAGDASRPRVVLLSERPDGEDVYSALAAGAAGYLAKDTDPDAVCAAVTGSGDGMAVLAPQLQSALADGTPSLTEREQEVLRLTAEGHS